MKNRDLDKWIAEHVMGWMYSDIWDAYMFRDLDYTKIDGPIEDAIIVKNDDWHPTEFYDQAFQVVVEKMIEKGFAFQLFCNMGTDSHIVDNWVSAFFKPFGSGLDAIAETIPLSICLAAKKAIEEME